MSSDVAGRVDASWQGLNDALEGIPENRMSEPGVVGVWSVKDTLAHVAFWEDRTIDHQEAKAAGRKLEPFDWRTGNDEVARERAGWTLQQARQELDKSHNRVLATLRDLPEVESDEWADSTYEHYDEHAAEIRAWREREGI